MIFLTASGLARLSRRLSPGVRMYNCCGSIIRRSYPIEHVVHHYCDPLTVQPSSGMNSCRRRLYTQSMSVRHRHSLPLHIPQPLAYVQSLTAHFRIYFLFDVIFMFVSFQCVLFSRVSTRGSDVDRIDGYVPHTHSSTCRVWRSSPVPT